MRWLTTFRFVLRERIRSYAKGVYEIYLASLGPRSCQLSQSPLHARNWGERERAPTLMMSMAVVSVRPSVCPSVRPRTSSCLRMREIM